MTEAERAFYRLLSELASEGVFANRLGVAERLADAFETAIEAAKRENRPPPEGRAATASQQ